MSASGEGAGDGASLTRVVEARYEARASAGEGGSEESVEVTLRPAALPEGLSVDAACERAAAEYVEVVGRITRGLVRAVDAGGGQRAFKVLGVGPTLLRFGALERRGEGHYALPVMGGLLARRAGGALVFRWTSGEGEERFETAVEAFHPTLVGPGGTRVGRLFYRLTQQVAHRWVMRRYHDEVSRERVRLLGYEG